MHKQVNKGWKIIAWIGLVILGFSSMAAGDVPIQGMPVPGLAVFDQIMKDFMDDNNIEAGLLGIMRNGVIVYHRGFGWKDSGHTEHLRHDALMRIASVNKPFTAAATQRLIAGGFLAANDLAFNVSPAGGILNYAPFPNLGDPDFALITVQHLYTHRGGWDRGISGDHTNREVQIADDFNNASIPTPYPPGRERTVRWIMGQPLPHTPGSQRVYSNEGFLVLGLIVEQVSGNDLIPYVRDTVLGPLDWVPVTELVRGRTFPGDLDWREPWYDCDQTAQNVFDPDGPDVIRSEGGWDHEARIGQGGMVSSTTIMLHLAENYYISDRFVSDPTYGLPTGGVRDNRRHTGVLFCGTESLIVQRIDGINFAVIFNDSGNDVNGGGNYSDAIRALIEGAISSVTWPTQGVDGQWVDFNATASGNGSFEEPWGFFSLAVNDIADEGTLNIKPGTSSWTGTIDKKVRIRVPLGGVVTIGQ
jgi:CubicO group peptidase (beta-lactamase class C family)